MFRRPLMVLLSLGVVFGYGGAFASFRHHAHAHECGGRWGDNRWERWEQRATPAAAPVIVQAPAPAPAPASAPVVTPQVFIIMPGGAPPVPAAVIPAANVAPASAAP